MRDTNVVLGIDEPRLQNEVLDYLERLPHVRVVASTGDPSALARQVRRQGVDAAVVSPQILDADLDGVPLLIVAPRETTEDLRRAVRAGARGFYLWPDERDALARDAERTRSRSAGHDGERGALVAVCGAKGGTGGTFVATNLVAGLADLGASPLLLDLAVESDDIPGVLGFEEGAMPVIDALALASELPPEELRRVAGSHDRGFHVLGVRDAGSTRDDGLFAGLTRTWSPAVAHVPRSADPGEGVLSVADRVLIVVTLDVPSIRAARRLVDALGAGGRDRCRLVVNRATRGEIVPADAEEGIGVEVLGLLPNDRAAERTQNRGELVPRGSGRLGRAVARLARALMEELS